MGRLLNESVKNSVNVEVVHRCHVQKRRRSTLVDKASVARGSVLRWAHEYE